MTFSEEIQYLRDQIRKNQVRYARGVQENDCIVMDYLEKKNRDLIDKLNKMENTKHPNDSYNRGSELHWH